MDSLHKTRSLFYIKVHEAKKALIKDIGPVNRVLKTSISPINMLLIYVLIVLHRLLDSIIYLAFVLEEDQVKII